MCRTRCWARPLPTHLRLPAALCWAFHNCPHFTDGGAARCESLYRALTPEAVSGQLRVGALPLSTYCPRASC